MRIGARRRERTSTTTIDTTHCRHLNSMRWQQGSVWYCVSGASSFHASHALPHCRGPSSRVILIKLLLPPATSKQPRLLKDHGLVNGFLMNPGAMQHQPHRRAVDTALPDGGDVTAHLLHAFAGHRICADQIGNHSTAEAFDRGASRFLFAGGLAVSEPSPESSGQRPTVV